MQLLTFIAYACVCVALAVGIAPEQIRRAGSRWRGYLVLSASVAAMFAALWFVSRPIASLLVPNTQPHVEAAAPSPHPVSPPLVVSPSTGEPTVAPDTDTATAVPTQPAVTTPPDQSSPTPSAPSGPTTPPTQPPPTQPPPSQPPPTQPPPTDHPANPAQHLVRSVIHAVDTVIGSLHRAV